MGKTQTSPVSESRTILGGETFWGMYRMLIIIKRALEFSSALVYNLFRKVFGIEVSDCPQ